MFLFRFIILAIAIISITCNVYAQSEYAGERMLGTGFTTGYVKSNDVDGFALSAGASANMFMDFGLSFARTSSNNDITVMSFAPYLSVYLLKKYFRSQNVMLAFHAMLQHDSYSFPDDYGYLYEYGYTYDKSSNSKNTYGTGLALTANFFTDQEVSLQLSGGALYVNILDYDESKHLMTESGISFCLHTKKDLIIIINMGFQYYNSDYTYSIGTGLVFEKLKR